MTTTFSLFPGNPCIDHREENIPERTRAAEQIKALKDETNLAVAYVGKLIIRQAADKLASQPVFPLSWTIKTADEIHEGGFT